MIFKFINIIKWQLVTLKNDELTTTDYAYTYNNNDVYFGMIMIVEYEIMLEIINFKWRIKRQINLESKIKSQDKPIYP